MTSTTTLAPISNLTDVFSTIADSLAPSTQNTYEQQLKLMREHYSRRGWEIYPYSPEGEFMGAQFVAQVLSYLQELQSRGRTVSTLVKTLSALKNDASAPEAIGLLNSKAVNAFMHGVRRNGAGYKPRKAKAFSLQELKVLHASLKKQHSVRATRDRAILALGVATALRSSELTALTLGDLTPMLIADGFLVTVTRSKTDQTGEGRSIPFKSSSNSLLDPVKALKEWLRVLAHFGFSAEVTPNAPLFPNMRGNSITGAFISHPAVTLSEMLRRSVVKAGVCTVSEAQAFSSHSLRTTFITLSSQAGVSERLISEVSGHKNMHTLRGYDRTAVEAFAQTEYLGE
ncbi:site-specific recombinase XerD [Leucobacter luti]|uniref:Site-specific recombinase XerD n=1 Tax=Leucobacter luti TaxID=340320 RepID=A0A4R6RSD9_9MICO|nr:tyrosine-type recombinase/integrase [Leucobacter luti]TDP89789.1 site-specific recombinase XerD [Leucobacter luti]